MSGGSKWNEGILVQFYNICSNASCLRDNTHRALAVLTAQHHNEINIIANHTLSQKQSVKVSNNHVETKPPVGKQWPQQFRPSDEPAKGGAPL